MPSARFALPLAAVTVAALFALAAVSPAEPPPSGPRPDPVAALEGGTPVPDRPFEVVFPWMPKQSLSFVSDPEIERMVGMVNFGDAGTEPVGTARWDGKDGTAAFTVPVAKMTTGVEGRDDLMAGAVWLDAANHPNVTFKVTKAERLKPTVFRVSGTWSMHGVEKPITVLANVRYFPELANFGKDVVRLKAEFSVSLKEFGVTNEYVGTPVVAESWDVSMVLLGLITAPK